MYINIFTGETKKRLRKERSELYGTRAAALTLAAAKFATSKNENDPELIKYQTVFHEAEMKIQQVESKILLTDAYYLGIEYPTKDEKPDWWVLSEAESWLSEKGLINLNKLVKEEKRKNMEWWVTICASLIGALTGLVGTVIALIAILHTLGRF